MVLTLTWPTADAEAAVGLADVLEEMRESSRRRAPASAFVDERGITGVLAGTAPVLFVAPWASGHRAVELAAVSDELCEMQVAAQRTDVIAALTSRGWALLGRSSQVVLEGAAPRLVAAPAGYRIVRLTDPAAMWRIRELLITTFDAPRHVIEAGYPDDFLERAAPVELLGAYDAAGRLIGCVAWRRQVSSALVFALSVDPAHRGDRLGAALATTATAAALKSGVGFVHANVEGDGVGLARACGFSRVGSWVRLVRPALS